MMSDSAMTSPLARADAIESVGQPSSSVRPDGEHGRTIEGLAGAGSCGSTSSPRTGDSPYFRLRPALPPDLLAGSASTTIRQFGNRLLPNYGISDGLNFTAVRNKIAWQLLPYLCNGLLHNSPRSMNPSGF